MPRGIDGSKFYVFWGGYEFSINSYHMLSKVHRFRFLYLELLTSAALNEVLFVKLSLSQEAGPKVPSFLK